MTRPYTTIGAAALALALTGCARNPQAVYGTAQQTRRITAPYPAAAADDTSTISGIPVRLGPMNSSPNNLLCLGMALSTDQQEPAEVSLCVPKGSARNANGSYLSAIQLSIGYDLLRRACSDSSLTPVTITGKRDGGKIFLDTILAADGQSVHYR